MKILISISSTASEKAKELGLTYKGFGWYADKKGVTTHKSVDGKLRKLKVPKKPKPKAMKPKPKAMKPKPKAMKPGLGIKLKDKERLNKIAKLTERLKKPKREKLQKEIDSEFNTPELQAHYEHAGKLLAKAKEVEVGERADSGTKYTEATSHTMREVKVGGATIRIESKGIQTQRLLAHYLSLPEHLKEQCPLVNFFTGSSSNEYNKKFEKLYKTPGFQASAWGGKDEIALFNSDIRTHRSKTLPHELGHSLDHNTGRFFSYEMSRIDNSEEAPPTEYGATNDSEDFAESVGAYYLDKEEFKKKCPRRFKIIDAILTKKIDKKDTEKLSHITNQINELKLSIKKCNEHLYDIESGELPKIDDDGTDNEEFWKRRKAKKQEELEDITNKYEKERNSLFGE